MEFAAFKQMFIKSLHVGITPQQGTEMVPPEIPGTTLLNYGQGRQQELPEGQEMDLEEIFETQKP